MTTDTNDLLNRIAHGATDGDDSDAVEAIIAERDRLHSLINRPEILQFTAGVEIEAAHQRELWGEAHDAGKDCHDWYWVLGFLSGKALRAHIEGDLDKARHHTISSAALLAHWHQHLMDEQPTGGKHPTNPPRRP